MENDTQSQIEILKALLFQAWLYVPYNTIQAVELHQAISEALKDWNQADSHT